VTLEFGAFGGALSFGAFGASYLEFTVSDSL